MGAFVTPGGLTAARPSRAAAAAAAAAVRRSPPHAPRPACRPRRSAAAAAVGGAAGSPAPRRAPTMVAPGGALPAAAGLLLADDIYGQIALGGFAIIASGVVGALVTGWLVNRNYDVVRWRRGGWVRLGGGGWAWVGVGGALRAAARLVTRRVAVPRGVRRVPHEGGAVSSAPTGGPPGMRLPHPTCKPSTNSVPPCCPPPRSVCCAAPTPGLPRHARGLASPQLEEEFRNRDAGEYED